MTNIKLVQNTIFFINIYNCLYWMRNRRKYKKNTDINYDRRMTFLGAKHPFSWLAIKQRSKRAVVISFLGACIYVYISRHIHTYIHETARLADYLLEWATDATSFALTRQYRILSVGPVVCACVRKWYKRNSGERRRFIGADAPMHFSEACCIHPRGALTGQVLRYVSLDLQFKSRFDRAP